jgi:2-phosphoglycerate kinase
LATIVDGDKLIPYMRGMLVGYLIEREFSHDEAYKIADTVREVLGKQKTVSKEEIVELISRLIIKVHGTERPFGDLVFWQRRPSSISVERQKGVRPFSKEVLSHSIQASGLPPDQSYQLARRVETLLMDGRREGITHRELERIAARMLADHHGQAYAERYKVWRTWGDVDRPLIVLIGGASGVGKTTLAVGLANVLDIPRLVSTDDIRQVMRLMLSPELMPAIHASSYALGEMSAADSIDNDPVIAGFREQAKVVNVGVRAILDRAVEENTSVIIDGVHLLPDFIDLEAFRDSAFLVPIGLAVSDRRLYEDRFAKRQQAAPARSKHKYLSRLEEILKIQRHILDSCNAADIPVIDTAAVEDGVSTAVMVVAERLQEHAMIRKMLRAKEKKKIVPKKKGKKGK